MWNACGDVKCVYVCVWGNERFIDSIESKYKSDSPGLWAGLNSRKGRGLRMRLVAGLKESDGRQIPPSKPTVSSLEASLSYLCYYATMLLCYFAFPFKLFQQTTIQQEETNVLIFCLLSRTKRDVFLFF